MPKKSRGTKIKLPIKRDIFFRFTRKPKTGAITIKKSDEVATLGEITKVLAMRIAKIATTKTSAVKQKSKNI